MPRVRPQEIPIDVLQAWGFEIADIDVVNSGLINRTWRIRLPEKSFALQWLNPIFPIESIRNLELVTTALDAAGFLTPLLQPTLNGMNFYRHQNDTWRCLSWIEGESFDAAGSSARCREAGRILGVFHGVFWNSSIPLSEARSPIHDLERHRNFLKESLQEHQDHRFYGKIRNLVEHILSRSDPLPEISRLPKRLVHGDPKISNILFDPQGKALCLIDLDTACRATLADELGDALRSWCHPGFEDEIAPFSIDRFQAAMEGWFEGIGNHRPEEAEIMAIPAGIERISLELASRFAADALLESYFGWDEERYPSNSEHNIARARSQFSLALSVATERPRLQAYLRDLLTGNT